MSQPTEHIENGHIREFDGKVSIYYDGYWIRYYAPPPDTLEDKKNLIESLGRRAFHHTERGINTPGERLELARQTFEQETDPARKRVTGAMLAGALFNRAIDIFTSIVVLNAKGVIISETNDLMRECGENLKAALEYGKMVKHYSGEEGIDELWGEPFKAFTMPMEAFYESRYIKIAQTMRDIDEISAKMGRVFGNIAAFAGVESKIRELATSAKMEAETIKRDWVIFEVWPRFVADMEAVESFQPKVPPHALDREKNILRNGRRLLIEGTNVLNYIAGARVPMPKTKREYLEKCDAYARAVEQIDLNPPGIRVFHGA
ncbi:MAG: hypothetical protein OES09_09385 [Gammaproteobacteria bacterium]|nr:hypothetical protein [Gammaproteobacteria bacterium]